MTGGSHAPWLSVVCFFWGGGNPYVKIDSGQNGTKFTDCLKFFNMFVIVFIQRFRENRRGTVSSHQTLMRGRTYLWRQLHAGKKTGPFKFVKGGGGNITYMYQLYLTKAKCRRGWGSEVEFIIIVDQNVLDLLLNKGNEPSRGWGGGDCYKQASQEIILAGGMRSNYARPSSPSYWDSHHSPSIAPHPATDIWICGPDVHPVTYDVCFSWYIEELLMTLTGHSFDCGRQTRCNHRLFILCSRVILRTASFGCGCEWCIYVYVIHAYLSCI